MLLSKKNADLVLDKDWLVSKHFLVMGRGMLFFQLGETYVAYETSHWVSCDTRYHKVLSEFGACTLCLECINHCRSQEKEKNKEVGSRVEREN